MRSRPDAENCGVASRENGAAPPWWFRHVAAPCWRSECAVAAVYTMVGVYTVDIFDTMSRSAGAFSRVLLTFCGARAGCRCHCPSISMQISPVVHWLFDGGRATGLCCRFGADISGGLGSFSSKVGPAKRLGPCQTIQPARSAFAF